VQKWTTPDILAPSDWCRILRTVRHQCRSVLETTGTNCLNLQQTFFAKHRPSGYGSVNSRPITCAHAGVT